MVDLRCRSRGLCQQRARICWRACPRVRGRVCGPVKGLCGPLEAGHLGDGGASWGNGRAGESARRAAPRTESRFVFLEPRWCHGIFLVGVVEKLDFLILILLPFIPVLTLTLLYEKFKVSGLLHVL